MSRTPKLTVCIPTYNRADYLAQCLASVLDQTFQDFEVIVSDNCSSDETPEIVRACGDARVTYHRNQSNIGAFPNMNRCIELARGEYVCILHDDDLYAPRFLEREAAMLDRHPTAGFVHCAVYEIDDAGVRRRLARVYPDDRLLNSRREFMRYLSGHNVRCSTVMARRTLYERAGGFDPAFLCADYLMWLKFALQADVAYVAQPLSATRVHRSALSSSIPPARWCQEYLAIMKQGMDLADSADPTLLSEKDQVLCEAIRAQGARFFIAAVAAISEGNIVDANGYIEVLHQLEGHGLPCVYARLAKAVCNPLGQWLLTAVRRCRRAQAVQSLPAEAPWWEGRVAAHTNVPVGCQQSV